MQEYWVGKTWWQFIIGDCQSLSLHNVGDEEFPTTLPKTYLDEHLYNTDRDQFPLLEAILEQFVYKFCFLILELLLVDYFLRF